LQQKQSNKKGIILFGTIVLIFLVICLFAFVITGNKGIEERFSNAVGLPSESEGGDNGFLGFTLEGNHIYYIIILALVIIATVLIYRKYKV